MPTQALVPTDWALDVLEAFSRERPLLACVLVALHNRLALAPDAEERRAAAQALVRGSCVVVCGDGWCVCVRVCVGLSAEVEMDA